MRILYFNKLSFLKNINNFKLLIFDKNSLDLKPIPWFKLNIFIFTFILLIFIVVGVFIGYNYGMLKGMSIQQKILIETFNDYEKKVIIEEADVYTEEKFVEMLKQINIKFPHIVMAQAIIESASGTSALFKSNHNLFGMKAANVRPNANRGTENNHAMYYHWRESVYDYALWQSYTNGAKLKTDEEYYGFLKSIGYAEAENYIEALKSTVEKYKLKELFK